jgi:hypothetical protein
MTPGAVVKEEGGSMSFHQTEREEMTHADTFLCLDYGYGLKQWARVQENVFLFTQPKNETMIPITP